MEKTADLRHETTKENALSVSLFDEIPVGRTCRSAGVAVHWCMCTYTEPVAAAGNDNWQTTAEWVVSRVNALLQPAITDELCHPLTLMHVVNAFYVIPTDIV